MRATPEGSTDAPAGVVQVLRTRYRVALALIAATAVGSAITAIVTVRLDEGNAAQVNVSGRQRMLSQRIALTATRAVALPVGPDRTILREAVDLMRESHARLSDPTVDPDLSGRLHDELRALYGEQQEIGARVEAYLDSAEVVLGWLESNARSAADLPGPSDRAPPPRVRGALDFIVDQAEGPLLPGLDSVVNAYQAVGDRAIGRTIRVQIALAGVLLMAIAATGAAIFAPMGRTLQHSMETLLEREDRLRRAQHLHQIGLLASNVAHDLKNYTGVAKGNLQLLREDLEAEGMDTTGPDEALASVERIDGTARRLLALAQEEDGPTREVDLQQLLRGMEKLLIGAARPAAGRVETEASPVPVRIVPTQLEAALLNLVGNARDAVAGGRGGSVVVRSRREGDEAVVEVEDDGPGIPEEILPDLFLPFVSGKAGGSGLGLAQVHGFADAAGGEVRFDTSPSGTRFELRLPVADGEEGGP